MGPGPKVITILSIEQTDLDKPCPLGGKLLLQSAFQSCFERLKNSLGHPCTAVCGMSGQRHFCLSWRQGSGCAMGT